MVAPGLASTLTVADSSASGAPRADDIVTLTAPLAAPLTDELDGAGEYLGVTVEEILLAALAGAVAKTFGEGELRVDVATPVGTEFPVTISCVDHHGSAANEALVAVRRALATAPRRGPHDRAAQAQFGYRADGVSDEDTWNPDRALQVRALRRDGTLELQWRYDMRRFFAATVAELAEQFPLALIEITSEAVAPIYGVTPVAARSYA
ncbi:hypothetical protein LV457_13410 [Mycobacterium sp. MYCO198283]|uniref:hypothetical protein n=1 Tax=Mycobacterium sp. MYCO198283 TaxID=2883505 RepID=UPI001E5C3345|nr:hypothetical protein [Mycobacterium sp. MYCO198283]MCG5433277.1 hypothetical protein [Mycobacterium sp. MYCO198283]